MREATHKAAKLALIFVFERRESTKDFETILTGEPAVGLAEEMAKSWNGGIADRQLVSCCELRIQFRETPQNIQRGRDTTVAHHAGALQLQT
jgi:hypothetical protein